MAVGLWTVIMNPATPVKVNGAPLSRYHHVIVITEVDLDELIYMT